MPDEVQPRARRRRIVAVAVLVVLAGTFSSAWWFLRVQALPGSLSRVALLAAGCLLVAAATSINLMLRWLRWQFLLRHLGVRIPARRSLTIFCLLLPAVATPFAVGELLLGLFLKPYTPRPWKLAFSTWFLARFTDVLVLALLLSEIGGIVLAVLVLLSLLIAIFSLLPVGGMRRRREYSVLAVLYSSLSVVAWMLPIVGLWAACRMIAMPLSARGAIDVFCQSTLLGGLTGAPGGIVVTGSDMIVSLTERGAEPAAAVQLVAVFRAGTVVFAVCVGMLIWLLRWKQAAALLAQVEPASQEHFDALSSEYQDEFQIHVRDHFLKRKIALMQEVLADRGIAAGAKGLDLGCGPAWYALALAKLGYAMTGCDPSAGQLNEARANAAREGIVLDLCESGMDAMPFADSSFDFVYAINVLHHVTDPATRAAGLREIGRVLKPGGVFFLHEVNVRNPLFRFYASYLFPLAKRIDDGTESWIAPVDLPPPTGAEWEGRYERYFTFIPDFAPLWLMRLLLPIEAALERSPLRVWSAHFMAVMVDRREVQP